MTSILEGCFKAIIEFCLIDHLNIMETPKIDPYTYSQMIFDKAVKAIQWSKDSHY